jgi:hypothetical protein
MCPVNESMKVVTSKEWFHKATPHEISFVELGDGLCKVGNRSYRRELLGIDGRELLGVDGRELLGCFGGVWGSFDGGCFSRRRGH